MLLQSENICLRKVEPSDVMFLYLVENQDYNMSGGVVHNPLSHKDLLDFVNNSTADIYKDGQLRLIIEQKSDNSTIGIIDLFNLDIFNSKVELGIYIVESERRKHYAMLAIKIIEDYVFHFLKMRLVYAFVAYKNIASVELFRSSDYKQSAPLPKFLRDDDVVYFFKESDL